MKIYDNNCFQNSKHLKNCVKPLYEKNFNQPDELNLIAIIKYNNHKLRNFYYDRLVNNRIDSIISRMIYIMKLKDIKEQMKIHI